MLPKIKACFLYAIFIAPQTSNVRNILEREVKIMIPAVRAFQIALEDPQTISFIRIYFSSPEQCPQITSRRWLSAGDLGFMWNIEFLEKRIFSFRKKVDLINVVLLEVDTSNGKITSRAYFTNILMSEYEAYLMRSSGDALSNTF